MNKNQERKEKEPAQNSGILKGVGGLIDDALQEYIPGLKEIGRDAPHYTRKTASNRLLDALQEQSAPDFKGLLARMLKRIHTNYEDARAAYDDPRSVANWRLEKMLACDRKNPSDEKTLEKGIAAFPCWFNQIPAASGYTEKRQGKRAIDLCFRVDGRRLAFLELKWGCAKTNYNILSAAFEVLGYGLLYLFARTSKSFPHYRSLETMCATHVLLAVLAPEEFYKNYPLKRLDQLEDKLDEAVCNLSRSQDARLNMGFRFLRFPASFKWPRELEQPTDAVESIEDQLRAEALWKALERNQGPTD